MNRLDFRQDADLKEKMLRWWESLAARRGDRAELARATSIDDVFRTATFYRLKRMLSDYQVFDPALARTAGVLARIRRDRDGESLGILLYSAGCRFERLKRLEKVSSPDRLLQEWRHLVMYLKGEAPIVGTADIVYWWEIRKPNREFFYDFFLKEGASKAVATAAAE